MKIYTKTGDLGQTSLIGGSRVPKSHLRIETYGTIDELNSWVGVLSDYTINSSRLAVLRHIQDRLFVIGAQLATEPGKENNSIPVLHEEEIHLLEKEIDKMNETLEPMRNFILPSGHKEVSFAHVARTVCRRAERLTVRLSEQEVVNELIIKYLNRLSDYIFVLCRAMGKDLGVEEVAWKPAR